MASSIYPAPYATRTVAQGMSARAGLAAFRSAEGKVNDAKWFRLVAEARRALAGRLDEAMRPLGRRPSGNEISIFSTKSHTGYVQMIEVFVYDRNTKEVLAKYHGRRTDQLITRQAAIAEAIAEFQAGVDESPDDYNEEILGAAYVGTYQLIPRGE